MAHFQLTNGIPVSEVNVILNDKLSLEQWGGGPDNNPLKLISSNAAIVEIGSEKISSNTIQQFTLSAKSVGTCHLQALVTSGPATGANWSQPLKVTVAPGMLSTLVDAVNSNQLIFNNLSDRNVLLQVSAGQTVNGNTVRIANGLQNLLVSLLKGGKVTVMSLYRFNGGPHGEIQPDKSVICRAVDIAAYNSTQIGLANSHSNQVIRDTAVRVVCSILANFPQGEFNVGFPRPKAPPLDFDPVNDVFFSVPDQAAATACEAGLPLPSGRDLSNMLEPARTQVGMALTGNTKAQVTWLFADGLNHLHIKAK